LILSQTFSCPLSKGRNPTEGLKPRLESKTNNQHRRLTARRLSRTQRGRVSAPASVGSNRWLGRRERSEPGLPAGAARRAVKPSAKRSA